MIKHEYTIDVVKVHGKVFLNLNQLEDILTLETNPPKRVTKKITMPTFKEKVESIWHYCVDKKSRPWDNPNNIPGYSLINVFYFDKERLEENKINIIFLLNQVNSALTYEDLKVLNNGVQWSKLRIYVEMLISLGNALNLIFIKEKSRNPEIAFNLTRKQ